MAQPMEREEQTYQKEGSLESQISKLEMRVLALECKDTSTTIPVDTEETTASDDIIIKGKDGEDMVIPF